MRSPTAKEVLCVIVTYKELSVILRTNRKRNGVTTVKDIEKALENILQPHELVQVKEQNKIGTVRLIPKNEITERLTTEPLEEYPH